MASRVTPKGCKHRTFLWIQVVFPEQIRRRNGNAEIKHENLKVEAENNTLNLVPIQNTNTNQDDTSQGTEVMFGESYGYSL